MGLITLESVAKNRAFILELNYLNYNLKSIESFSPRAVLLLSRYIRYICAVGGKLPRFEMHKNFERMRLCAVLQEVMKKDHSWLYFGRYGRLFRGVEVVVTEDGSEFIDMTMATDSEDEDERPGNPMGEFLLETPPTSPIRG